MAQGQKGMNTDTVEGGCCCGSIRYRVNGEPTNSMICHCRTCRKAAGAPVVAWVTFPIERFAFTHGQAIEFHSSQPVTRTLCGSCGTPLTYQHADDLSSIDVTTCSLDEPESFPPTHHSWVSHDVQWVRFEDGLPSFQATRREEERSAF